MRKNDRKRRLTLEMIAGYENYLREEEKSRATIQKYMAVLQQLYADSEGETLTKEWMIGWKERLTERYQAVSANAMLAAVNGFLAFAGWQELRLKPFRIQRRIFCEEKKELSRSEYIRLVQAAKQEGNERLSLVLQTICATGIRVSELQYITAEALAMGKAEIHNKGKLRVIFLPKQLRCLLRGYMKRQKRTTGAVFVTKTGRVLDRSNIWREMKRLCEQAHVESGKVFPHNLRHLFARTYYALERDISRLADLLGHSNINTTRIYTMESGEMHLRQMERMRLIVT